METPSKSALPTEFKTARRKFTQSILKWLVDENAHEEEKPASTPDVGDLVNILRSVGFKLRKFEKSENIQTKSASTCSLNNTKCKVELTCGQSGLCATLESMVGECRCPSLESAEEAEFWHVSGSGPAFKGSQDSLSSVQEAGSTLIPPLPPAVGAVVKDVMARILNLICDPKLTEQDLFSRSIIGNVNRDIRRHSSLNTLHVSEQTSSSFSELLDSTEKGDRRFSRTISNIDLPTCPLSPVPGKNSAAESFERCSSWSTITTSHCPSSPASKLSENLEKVSINEKNLLFCRLEVARRSIVEVMSMLDLQCLPTHDTRTKQTLLENSTPTNRTRRPAIIKSPVQKYTKQNVSAKMTTRKSMPEQSINKKVYTPTTAVKKTVPSTPKTAPRIPVPTKQTVRSQSSTVNAKVKKQGNFTLTDGKVGSKSDISTSSTSSASSSSKVRMFKSVVRRVSKLSSGGNSPQSSEESK